jgi:RNA polymerase sigma factor (sigma-70 family)
MELRWESDVVKAAGGDQSAYARLIDGTRGLVCSLALAVVRDAASSQDVAQEVYLAVWQNLPRLRNPAAFLPWLRQLTRNRAHDHLRAQRRRSEDAEGDATITALADVRPNASELLIAREEGQALAAALAELPDEAREVLTLFYREGRSVAQVAMLLGLNEGAVKTRLSRARAALRQSTLERLGSVLERTAPGAAFTAAVVSALTSGVPATATAAALTKVGAAGSKAGTAFGGTLVGKLLVAVSGLWGALIGAIIYQKFIFPKVIAPQCKDDEEIRERRRTALVGGLVGPVIIAVQSLVLMPFLPRALVLPIGMALPALGVSYCLLIWVPRVHMRTRARQGINDPRFAKGQRVVRVMFVVFALAVVAVAGGFVVRAAASHALH